jgi:RsiW-degrading membrane proteinase PrsW (M82 family)
MSGSTSNIGCIILQTIRAREILYHPNGEPRLFAPGIAMVVLAFVLTLVVVHFAGRAKSDQERADTLMHSGKAAEAEHVYAALVRSKPDVANVLALLKAHNMASAIKKIGRADLQAWEAVPPLADEEIDAIVDGLPPDMRTIARFVRGMHQRSVPPDARAEIEEGSKRDPPVPWTNHVLAESAAIDGDELLAASFYLREGIAFPERHVDVDHALGIWIEAGAWEEIDERMQDTRVADRASPGTRYEIAVHRRDWKGAVKAMPGAWAPRFNAGAFGLAGVAALAWAFFCARLGKMGGRPKVRLPLYVIAFVLGVVSVAPTMFLIAIEEAKLKLVETGEPGRDILFFVFGVGLREEFSKLLLFAPLLIPLRKWGDKLDVLVCGAMVGLGFAAEENLGYLSSENLHTGLARFLTANFMHMAMTGILASALDDFVRDTERSAPDFTRATLMVVMMHGAYDFLLSHPEFGGSFLAMAVFVLLTRLFLAWVDKARRRADRGITPVHAFILAVAAVTGTSLAHAFVLVGARDAGLVLAEGLLGEAVIVFVFVRTLHAM